MVVVVVVVVVVELVVVVVVVVLELVVVVVELGDVARAPVVHPTATAVSTHVRCRIGRLMPTTLAHNGLR